MYRGADVASDHHLKLKKLSQRKDHHPINIEKFKLKQVKENFELALQNRFSILSDLENLESESN